MKLRYLTSLILFGFAIFCFGQGGWIHAKAIVAQHLLQHAWARTELVGEPQKPWPWADTQSVARLSIPTLGEDYIVLDTGSGESMAFGPTLVPLHQPINNTTLIAGHRDTHLKFLQHLQIGEPVVINWPDGQQKHYTIDEFLILDSDEQQLRMDLQLDALVLVTCYPFDALNSGGSLRYVAIAQAKEKSVNTSTPSGRSTSADEV